MYCALLNCFSIVPSFFMFIIKEDIWRGLSSGEMTRGCTKSRHPLGRNPASCCLESWRSRKTWSGALCAACGIARSIVSWTWHVVSIRMVFLRSYQILPVFSRGKSLRDAAVLCVLTNALEHVCCLRKGEPKTAVRWQYIGRPHAVHRMLRAAAYKHTKKH